MEEPQEGGVITTCGWGAEWGDAEGSRWGFQNRRHLETRREFGQGGGDRRKTEAELFGSPQCCSPMPGAQLCENKEALAGWGGPH